MRSRHASSTARVEPSVPWRESVGLVIDLEARRIKPATEPQEAPKTAGPYSWEGFETANRNAAPPPRSRDLGSQRRGMTPQTRLLVTLFALFFTFLAPGAPVPPASAPHLAGMVNP